MSANDNDHVNDNDIANNIIFTIKGTKLYVPVVTLSVNENQKIVLAKDLKNQFIE